MYHSTRLIFSVLLLSPLGLSDKDMQLQYDNFPTNPEPSAEEGDEEEEVASANP
jgi:hypothetical protein